MYQGKKAKGWVVCKRMTGKIVKELRTCRGSGVKRRKDGSDGWMNGRSEAWKNGGKDELIEEGKEGGNRGWGRRMCEGMYV